MTEVAQQAQLDEPERRHLEKIVKQLRKRAEETVEYWVHSKLNLAEEGAEAPVNLSTEERELRGRVEEAIEREQAGERSWEKARDLYVKGVGYTLVNRLAALRCMEVRGFLDRSPTRFRDDGVTPAADRLITDYFLPREAGIWTAFLVACQERSEEIEILFDLSDPYSLLYGDLTGWDGEAEELAWSDDLQSSLVDLLQDLGGLLDEVDDAVWRADDVLGWVYEYYNVPDLEGVRSNVKTKEDAIAANQFYTPHWVVRMLTDNSLGKLFLEHQGKLQETINNQAERFTPSERKGRDPTEANSIEELCTYLVATEKEGESTDFSHPREIRVLDPACGSGHFLLYAFDVLERIWWAMEPSFPRAQVPKKILRHNLFGVDLDLRACQLAAFNLYLKARNQAEVHGNSNFEMPSVGIACADAHVADLNASHTVFEEVASDDPELRSVLNSIVSSFEQIEGLGSLLDVKGTMAELVEEKSDQLDAFSERDNLNLKLVLDSLHERLSDHIDVESFRAKDIQSFVRLLSILSQEYDTVLMNPPYGSGSRLTKEVKKYLGEKYNYKSEYYVSFFEAGLRLSKGAGRIGLLIPRSFMNKGRFESFRKDFIGERGGLDFLAEFGLGVLDNATVRTVGTVVKSEASSSIKGSFFRLYDVGGRDKEKEFAKSISGEERNIKRKFTVKLDEFKKVPRSPICYATPKSVRDLYSAETLVDAEKAGVDRKSGCNAIPGLVTGNDERFVRSFWETENNNDVNPLAYGGARAWLVPHITKSIRWEGEGKVIKRSGPSVRIPNESYYGKEGLSWTRIKSTGKRFGYYPGGFFSTNSFMLFAKSRVSLWSIAGVLNSKLYNSIFLAQTSERNWDAEVVGSAPFPESIISTKGIKDRVIDQYKIVLKDRINDPSSPYYIGPELLPGRKKMGFFYDHPHSSKVSIGSVKISDNIKKSESFTNNLERIKKENDKKIDKLDRINKELDKIIFERAGINEVDREIVGQEVRMRQTGGRSKSKKSGNILGDVSLVDYIKRLIHHLALVLLEEDDDGIVLLRGESEGEEADVLAKMIAKFEDIWDEYAEDRLQEVDEVLGTREPTDEPYPNLRHWLENDLFAFHCDEFENTPMLWELTTERLGEDNGGDAGFACLIDYHQVGPDVFDRLSARYLETRKAALRERQQSARRTAEGSEGTQAREARQEEKRCENALRQIDELETRISELTQTQPRDWADAVRNQAQDLQPKVRRFRERLEERLETLDALHEEAPSSWFKDHFSDKFMESVNGNREEWIDALEDLEAACEQFARPADEPVEAHLYDLLPYFDDLTGSTHYSSNGIFFLNYYFSKGKDLAAKIDQGNKDRVTRREQLVADLARETDDDIELGKEINEACQAMKKHMDSDWKPRALEEVRTPGYRPVKKHGVAINITPLAEKKLVPELVDKKVL